MLMLLVIVGQQQAHSFCLAVLLSL